MNNENKNFHDLVEGPGFALFITTMAFIISAYCTFTIFTADTSGFEFVIGIIKTLVLEICKLLFYFEQLKEKREKKKMSLFFILWLFFLGMSLLHTMNYEIGKINANENKIVSTKSGTAENKTNLEKLREDEIKKDNEIIKHEKEKKVRLKELRTDKNDLNKILEGDINTASKEMKESVNAIAKKFATNKNNLATSNVETLLAATTLKDELIKEIDNKITAEDKRIQENIKTAKKEKEEIKSNIKIETKIIDDKTDKTADDIKNTKGLNTIIDLLMNLQKETGKTIVILLLTLLVATGFDLAGCKTYQLYKQRLKYNESKPKKVILEKDIESAVSANEMPDTNLIETMQKIKSKFLSFNPFKKKDSGENDEDVEKKELKPDLTKKEKSLPDVDKIKPRQEKKEVVEKPKTNNNSNLSIESKNNIIKYLKYLYDKKLWWSGTPTGYKKIQSLSGLGDKASKIRSTLETLEIIGTDKKNIGKRELNVTKLNMDIHEAVKEILKK